MFWTPAFAGVTLEETFYETINLCYRKTGQAKETKIILNSPG
jgi:hypothetical protein